MRARQCGEARPIAHAIRYPIELMGAIASMTTGGVLERHPKLRCALSQPLRPKVGECLASEGWQPGARDAHGWSESIFNSCAT